MEIVWWSDGPWFVKQELFLSTLKMIKSVNKIHQQMMILCWIWISMMLLMTVCVSYDYHFDVIQLTACCIVHTMLFLSHSITATSFFFSFFHLSISSVILLVLSLWICCCFSCWSFCFCCQFVAICLADHSTCFVGVNLLLFVLLIILLVLLVSIFYYLSCWSFYLFCWCQSFIICLADHSTCFVGVNLLLFVLLIILLVLLLFLPHQFPQSVTVKKWPLQSDLQQAYIFIQTYKSSSHNHTHTQSSHSHQLPSSWNLNYMISSSTMTSWSIVSHSNRLYIVSSKWVIVQH